MCCVVCSSSTRDVHEYICRSREDKAAGLTQAKGRLLPPSARHHRRCHNHLTCRWLVCASAVTAPVRILARVVAVACSVQAHDTDELHVLPYRTRIACSCESYLCLQSNHLLRKHVFGVRLQTSSRRPHVKNEECV